MSLPYNKVILDIEGTICPISFVKDQLFPFFLNQLPSLLSEYSFPLTSESSTPNSNDAILQILSQFPPNELISQKTLLDYINSLVKHDVKDPILKQLQGFIWEKGYTTGSILAPLYDDAIEAFKNWSALLPPDSIYIYSSGSVKAQKLLFANVKTINSKGDVTATNMNALIDDYFDTVNIGPKLISDSYTKILERINCASNESEKVLFLSDNPLEVDAAIKAGLLSYIVVRPGNNPLTDEQKQKYTIIKDFNKLFPL